MFHSQNIILYVEVVHICSGYDTVDYPHSFVLQYNKIIKMSLICLGPHMNAITQIRIYKCVMQW